MDRKKKSYSSLDDSHLDRMRTREDTMLLYDPEETPAKLPSEEKGELGAVDSSSSRVIDLDSIRIEPQKEPVLPPSGDLSIQSSASTSRRSRSRHSHKKDKESRKRSKHKGTRHASRSALNPVVETTHEPTDSPSLTFQKTESQLVVPRSALSAALKSGISSSVPSSPLPTLSPQPTSKSTTTSPLTKRSPVP